MTLAAPIPRSGEPRLASTASWAVLAASFGLSASTWIALGRLAGFTDTVTVPGTGIILALAWLMPIAVDGYVVVALVLWMAPVPARVATFAKKNTYGAAGIGILAQSAYHLLSTLDSSGEWWRVVLAAVVGAIPPTVAGLAVHMRALIRRESGKTTSQSDYTEPVPATDRRTVAPARPPEPTPISVPSPVVSTVGTDVPLDVPAVSPPMATTPPPTGTPSSRDTEPVPVETPAVTPVIETPATVADRIAKPRPTHSPKEPATASRKDSRPRRPRPGNPTRPAPQLAPSTTDTPVSASDAAQLSLPLAPELLARATTVARQYQADQGTPITPGQLAARLKVNSDHAAQALALIDLDPHNPAPSTTKVNGRPVKATR